MLTFGFSSLSLFIWLVAAILLCTLRPGPASASVVFLATALAAVLTHLVGVAHRIDRLNRSA